MTERMKCTVHRCKKKEGMYLYLKEGMEPEDLPDALMKLTGWLEKSMDLELHTELKLARADVVEVMAKLEDQGFYLQMPPNLNPSMHFGD